MKYLNEMQDEVRQVNEANGWFDSERTFGEDIALLHSEVSEMLEAFRDHGTADMTRATLHWDTGKEYPPIVHDILARTGAGVVDSTLESDEEYDIIDDTMERVLVRHGVMKPEGVGSEAADVLIRLLDTCQRYGIDLDAEFNRKIIYNASRGHRHGGKRL